jgi:hypothetical protein
MYWQIPDPACQIYAFSGYIKNYKTVTSNEAFLQGEGTADTLKSFRVEDPKPAAPKDKV